jgi:hypothetical protein
VEQLRAEQPLAEQLIQLAVQVGGQQATQAVEVVVVSVEQMQQLQVLMLAIPALNH